MRNAGHLRKTVTVALKWDRRPRESGGPGKDVKNWIPAFAGMTDNHVSLADKVDCHC